MRAARNRTVWLALVTGGLLVTTFVVLAVRLRSQLQHEIHQTLIQRDGAVLHPLVLQLLASAPGPSPDDRLNALLRGAGERGVLSVALFDAEGRPKRAVPADQLFVDLPIEDFLQLTSTSQPLSRFHAHFLFDTHFPGLAAPDAEAPVLEVLLPLATDPAASLLGIARYHLDARNLADELAALDEQFERQTTLTVLTGVGLIVVVVVIAATGLARAEQALAERNQRLLRTNFELTLATKASALGQITAHLLHGLQGPVAGLRAAMAGSGGPEEASDWEAARTYTDRLQRIVEENVRMLADLTEHNTYELTGDELAETLAARNRPLAHECGVVLTVRNTFHGRLDNHRGSLLCLIAHNLVDNALRATSAGRTVAVRLAEAEGELCLVVQDEGTGIPESVQAGLFEPGRTTRRDGTGLGLAISRLLARQLRAELHLQKTGPEGSAFELRFPLTAAPL